MGLTALSQLQAHALFSPRLSATGSPSKEGIAGEVGLKIKGNIYLESTPTYINRFSVILLTGISNDFP